MAYHICYSPSSVSFHCKLQVMNFSHPFKFNFLSQQSKISLQLSNVSLQDPISQEIQNPNLTTDANSQYPDGKSSSSSKNSIWVNPKSPRVSKLRQQSFDARYASLVKLAESLDSCNPNEENAVFDLLKSVGDNILEQDAVTWLFCLGL